jgi:hypothetical protein
MSGTLSGGILPGTTGQADPFAAGVAGLSGVSLGTGTGQQGHQTVGGNGMGNPFVTVWKWLNTPFTTPLSPYDIALLVGIVLISIIAWNLVLYHIRIAAEAI